MPTLLLAGRHVLPDGPEGLQADAAAERGVERVSGSSTRSSPPRRDAWPPNFPDEGLRASLAARRQIPRLPVLVLSQYVEEAYAAELLGGGASGIGYLLKDRVGRVEEFLDALNRVAAGGTALDPEAVTELLTRRRSTPLDSLTPASATYSR